MAGSGMLAVLVIDLHFPEAGSLKAKRKELSSIKAQVQGRLGAAVSEVAFHDLWQRARLTAAFTGPTAPILGARVQAAEGWLYARWPEQVSIERIILSVEDLRGGLPHEGEEG
jgi:uncharacterized protein YlxP (DUF503 family)